MLKSLVIGNGEIGSALAKVLDSDVCDIEGTEGNYDILHIAFPYSEKFVEQVQEYKKKHNADLVVIHSTVPVGTSRKCDAIHSPVRGIHPQLEEGIRTFVKFLGGERASEVADYFRRKGLRVMLFDKQETTEAMKLFSTEYYRACIEFAHRVKKYCDENDLNYSEVYRLANLTYNEGYTLLGHPEFTRPILEPIMTPIGGHCVMNNKDLI